MLMLYHYYYLFIVINYLLVRSGDLYQVTTTGVEGGVYGWGVERGYMDGV